MKNGKLFILTFAAAVLSGCGFEQGTFVKSHLPSDYGLSCEDIRGEINTIQVGIRHNQAEDRNWGNREILDAVLRDHRARLTVLQGMQYQKGCVNPQAAGAAESGVQQPAAKEKSRVIICNDDQTCVVE